MTAMLWVGIQQEDKGKLTPLHMRAADFNTGLEVRKLRFDRHHVLVPDRVYYELKLKLILFLFQLMSAELFMMLYT